MESQKNVLMTVRKPDMEKLKNIIIQKSEGLYKKSQENVKKANNWLFGDYYLERNMNNDLCLCTNNAERKIKLFNIFVISIIVIILLVIAYNIGKLFNKKNENFYDFGIGQRREIRLSHTGSDQKSLEERGY